MRGGKALRSVRETPVPVESDGEESLLVGEKVVGEEKHEDARDACIGINGPSTYYSQSELELGEGDEDDVSDNKSEDIDMDTNVSETEGALRVKSRRKDDPLCPIVKVTKAEIKYACQPWRIAIIVKLLGQKMGMKFLRQRLIKLWQPEGGMDMIDLENDYFLIQFSNLAYVSRGPWMILDHYLLIRKWHLKFFPSQNDFKWVAVWVRVPGLPIDYYDKHILWRIGNGIVCMDEENPLHKDVEAEMAMVETHAGTQC
ncbi:hypothetical protein SESBI_25487 [Sesbania bispinosa]|nr:hypothetical protein SESBI_25487 [Sesbania bispinosa]